MGVSLTSGHSGSEKEEVGDEFKWEVQRGWSLPMREMGSYKMGEFVCFKKCMNRLTM